LVFLDHDPFADDVVLRSELVKPYEARKAGVLGKMRGLLTRFMLHRSKLSVQRQIDVPEIIEEEVRVTLTPTERTMYDELFQTTRSKLEAELLAVQTKDSKAKTDVTQLRQKQLAKVDELQTRNHAKAQPTAVAAARLNDAVRALEYIEAQTSEANLSALPNRWAHALSNIKLWLAPSTERRAAQRPKGLLAASGQLAMTAPLRALLTELRQLCCHVSLRESLTGQLTVSVSEALDRLIAERQRELEPLERALQRMPEPTTASLQRARQRASETIEEKRRMLSFLTQRKEQAMVGPSANADGESEANERCAICLDSFDDAVMTPCGHMFCYQCILGAVQGGSAPCPHCRAPITLNDLVHVEETTVRSLPDGCGAKLGRLVELIKLERGSAYKCIVFSQWTRLLDLAGNALSEARIRNIGCYGSSDEGRALAIDTFKKEQDCRVLLINLRSSSASAAAGLNLTEASDVYLLEPCLNFGLEAQAIARINRIGQTKQTRVRRLICVGTIEEDIVKMQAKSRKLQGKGCTSGEEDMQAHAIAAIFGLGRTL
jgi:SNF2 family DNA or RNA helicase